MKNTAQLLTRFSGAILLTFGVGLIVLGLWIVERQVTFQRAPDGTLIAVLTGFLLIALFCLPVGFRLAFNRPNRYGSLLPPAAWFALSCFFVVLGAFMTWFVAETRDFARGGTSIVFALAFAYRSMKAGTEARERGQVKPSAV